MKVFQILHGICHWDATDQFPTVESTVGYFPVTDVFVETPDYVFMGWGYRPDEEGDARFVKPTPPDGWLYDDKTGVFYPRDGYPPYSQKQILEQKFTDEELARIELGQQITELELMILGG